MSETTDLMDQPDAKSLLAVQADGTPAPLFANASDNPDNPKDKFGKAKVCVHFIPMIAMAMEAIVMRVGAIKYGWFNWREKKVEAETYLDGMWRHYALWQAGEDNDDETGVSHLASVRAGCGILIDAQAQGMLIDNRKPDAALIAFIKSQVKPVSMI
jgi:hypothetical protein